MSSPDPQPRESAPVWMDAAPASVHSRRGVAPKKGSSLTTVLFFGLIALGVLGAGLVGIAFWGPEKPIAHTNHFASEPAASEVASAAPSAEEPAAAAVESTPAPSEAPAAAPAKKAKRVAAPKKHR